jgi:hypothetical protein
MGYVFPTVFPTTLIGDLYTCSGYGFNVDFNSDAAAPKGSAYYAIIEALDIFNFDTGVNLHGYGASSAIASNTFHFKTLRLYGCKNNFANDGFGAVVVDEIAMQWTRTNPVPTVSGVVVNNTAGCEFGHIMMWDAPVNPLVLTFGATTYNNHVLSSHGITAHSDLGVHNRIEGLVANPEERYILPNIVMYPGLYDQLAFAGNQDDVLAFATRTGSGRTVTSTPSPGTEANMFDTLGSTHATYAAADNPVIEIVATDRSLLNLRSVGIAFSSSLKYALKANDTVLIEIYRSGAYETLWSYTKGPDTDPTKRYLVSPHVNYSLSGITKIRITIANSAEIRIARIWGFSWGTPGKAFVQPVAPVLWGTVIIKDRLRLPVLTGAPASPQLGDVCIADRTNWDPCGLGAGNAYVVWYDGGAWRQMHQQ